jgi:hypothetical protein
LNAYRHVPENPGVQDQLLRVEREKSSGFFYAALFPGAAGIIRLFAVDIVCPLFDNLLWRSAAAVMPLPG